MHEVYYPSLLRIIWIHIYKLSQYSHGQLSLKYRQWVYDKSQHSTINRSIQSQHPQILSVCLSQFSLYISEWCNHSIKQLCVSVSGSVCMSEYEKWPTGGAVHHSLFFICLGVIPDSSRRVYIDCTPGCKCEAAACCDINLCICPLTVPPHKQPGKVWHTG